MPDAIALGDINVDIIARFAEYPGKGDDALAYTTEIHCGGSAANTAITLARLGIETSLIARVGPDSWALKALTCLNEAGVDPRCLQRDPAAMTGLMYVIVTPDGERTILGNRGANVNTNPDQILEADIQQAQLFHLSGYALLSEPQRSAALLALEMACRHQLTVTLDPGMAISRSALDAMRAILPTVNVFLPSLPEARELCGLTSPEECAQALMRQGVQTIVMKLGHEGCLIARPEGMKRVPGFAIEARDSTGAGDSFAAGFIAGLLSGLNWTGAAVLGNAVGAMSVAQAGAGMHFPRAREALLILLRSRGKPLRHSDLDAIQQLIDRLTAAPVAQKEESEPWWA